MVQIFVNRWGCDVSNCKKAQIHLNKLQFFFRVSITEDNPDAVLQIRFSILGVSNSTAPSTERNLKYLKIYILYVKFMSYLINKLLL